MNKTVIIIQARTGSSRLPFKMLLPFYNDKTILDILIERILKTKTRIPIFVATTTHKDDDKIISLCSKYNINTYRGSEENVLSRFNEIASKYDYNTIIRVCADNPFFDIKGTLKLLETHTEMYNYTSYYLAPNIPSIATHLGFWGEIVNSSSLEKVALSTKENIYLEHVTNYIYTHQDLFKCKFVVAPKKLYNRTDIRLTLDTIEDFELYQKIYKDILNDNKPLDITKLINYIDNDKYIRDQMTKQIIQNTK